MPTKRVLCKYFKNGACFKGDSCEFSHDWNDAESNVCTYYQSGNCAYGSRCRYDHVKLKHPEITLSSMNSLYISTPDFSAATARGVQEQTLYASRVDAWGSPSLGALERAQEHDIIGLTSSVRNSSETPICSLAAAGTCTRGESCPYIHGDLCAICHKHCLHPHKPEDREEHLRQCERNQKRLEALRFSQEIECCICLDRVLSKTSVSERKFGLLAGCDHPFCISCIRGWRSSCQPQGTGPEIVVRTCPVCRAHSHYVIPSVIWYFSPEEKQEIVDGYKAKLSEIDCRYFDFGNASCPFGTSCFYKHALKDGRREEVKLRHLGAADGNTVIAKDVRLSEFLGQLSIRR